MHRLVRKALKQIKPNVNVKSLVYNVKGQLRKIAGRNKEMRIKSRKMFNKFNMKAQRKVRKIVRKLQLNIAKKRLLRQKQKNGLQRKLAERAVKYVKLAGERMNKCEKFITLSCKSSPKYCSFFKKSFVAAHPIVV